MQNPKEDISSDSYGHQDSITPPTGDKGEITPDKMRYGPFEIWQIHELAGMFNIYLGYNLK